MKFSKWNAFEKHLQETSSFASTYLVANSHETDRREIATKILAALQKQHPTADPITCRRFVGVWHFPDLFAELQTENLFQDHRVVVVDEIDKLKEDEKAYLKRWVQHPSSRIHLLLGFENAKTLSFFLSTLNAHTALLDLLPEKPWERQQRIVEDLRGLARHAKIIVEEAVWEFLLHRVGLDWTLLKSETSKLLAFAEQKKKIGLEEARSLVASNVFPEGWTLAEQLVFTPRSLPHTPFLDAGTLLALLGQLRYYLRMGWQLALGQENMLKPYQVQKFGDKAREKGPLFFERGIIVINDLEALAKSSSISSEILLHRFVVKLHGMAYA